MSTNCYKGIEVPTLIEEPCGGIYTLDSCIVHAEAITYLNLPANSKLDLIVKSIIISLRAKDDLISELEAQIAELQNSPA